MDTIHHTSTFESSQSPKQELNLDLRPKWVEGSWIIGKEKVHFYFSNYLFPFRSNLHISEKKRSESADHLLEQWKIPWEKFLENCFALGLNFYQQAVDVDTHQLQFFFLKENEHCSLFITSQKMSTELLILQFLKKWHLSQFDLDNSFVQFCSDIKKLDDLSKIVTTTTFEWELSSAKNPQLSPSHREKIKPLAELTATKLRSYISEYVPSFFEFLSNFGLNLVAQFSILRRHLLKFLALLPCLEHDSSGVEVKKLFQEALRRLCEDYQKSKLEGATDNRAANRERLPYYVFLIFNMTHKISSIIPSLPLSFMIRKLTGAMASRFIAGMNIEESEGAIKELSMTGREATLDQLGELVISPTEADHYCLKVLSLIRGLKKYYKVGEVNKASILKAHVSIKVTALGYQLKPYAFNYAYELIAPRLKRILVEAKKESVFINIDAEHYSYRDLVWNITKKLLIEDDELKDFANVGIVVQAYLRDSLLHLQEIANFAKSRNILMPIRLVKGAYWDAETVEARAHEYEAPQFLNKIETDCCFRQHIITILQTPFLQLTIGSHNFLDHAWAEAARSELYPESPVIEHQCLHQTYEALSQALCKMGWPTRNYMPVGDLLVGMSYLVRRIMENSSQVGVLNMMRTHQKIDLNYYPDEVLEKMMKNFSQRQNYFNQGQEKEVSSRFFSHSPFRGYKKNHFKKFEETILAAKLRNSQFEESELSLTEMENLLTKYSFQENFREDRNTLFQRVTSVLVFSHRLEALKNEFAALMMLESKKILSEVMVEIDEAIDFCQFYVREVLRLINSDEDIKPLGVVAAITPWNFPLAIPCGMVVAPLLMGNKVILKSAEQTPLIAEMMVQQLYASGISKEQLLHFVGAGETTGTFITNLSYLKGLVFTGSKNVGEMLYKKLAAKIPVITEMGGKNAVIVTENAELDETISGLLYSCFAHAGQKCSASSRIIVHEKIKMVFLHRFKEAAESLVLGKADQFSTYINPLISDEEKSRVLNVANECIEEAKKYGGTVHVNRLQINNVSENVPGLVGPLILEIPLHRALNPESFSQKELFAPIIHCVFYKTLDEAIHVFNSTSYALTGGLYSQSQDEIEDFLNRAEAGNLYVNRPNTGARVGIEPFGGYKFSGTGPKAGGKNYLGSFGEKIVDQVAIEVHHYQEIPGQKSYPLFTQKISNLLIYSQNGILSSEARDLQTLALNLGIKVDLLLQENNLDNQTLKIALENTDICYVELIKDEPFKTVLNNLDLKRGLPKIIGARHARNFKNYLYIERSAAINTMRHGAPLD